MKILLLISESWNDIAHPNNNMSNWFIGFPDLEIRTVSCGPEKPNNRCCKEYFCLNDMAMAKSILPGKKAGTVLHYSDYPNDGSQIENQTARQVYGRTSRMHNGFFWILRDMIWRFGRINKPLLRSFIDDFQPDIIFSQRIGSVKMCRLESVVKKMTSAPIVAYTGDNEYSVGVLSRNLFERLHQLWTRKWLNRMIPKYELYYSMSKEQMSFYSEKFGVETKFLVKCGTFDETKLHQNLHSPIRMVYAGKVYAGRWKTLSLIAKTLERVNKDGSRLLLDIYTPDLLSQEQREGLVVSGNSVVHPAVSAGELTEIFADSDIVIHAESFERPESEATRYSFSTKIMDCLSSGCATLAVCDERQAGYQYLLENDIAFTASSGEELYGVLTKIADDPDSVKNYAEKAMEFGRNNHSREYIQQVLKSDFERILSGKR